MKVQDLTIFRELKILNGMSDFYSILRKWRCIQRNFPNSVFSGSVPGFSILFRVGMHFWIVCYSHMGNSLFVEKYIKLHSWVFPFLSPGVFSAPACFDQVARELSTCT